ncbi:hydroxyacylglutathione hydrolase [Salmonella enterica subsp. enterica]|nr:hydroxyacylglutathione hydrolase [Salmonella enterica subsp. enterica serovar Enteritidis]
MTIDVHQFNCRADNFGLLIRDRATGTVALIDAPEEQAILDAIAETGWTPSYILTTHHHADHVEANAALKARYGLQIIAPAAEADRIPGVDRTVREGDRIAIGASEAVVIETPGHTAGHVSYHFPQAQVVFTADTLFALGCGRLFERPPEVMHASLAKLAALPPETAVYCGHEYTLSNARFARTIDPDNKALAARAAEIERLRAEGKATLPTSIGAELETNPFLRAADPAIRKHLGMQNATDAQVFAEIRKRKDNA